MSELTELERAHYNRIRELEASIREYDVAYQMAKAKAQDAKKDLELAIIDLRLCISKGPDMQKRLDFDSAWESVPISTVLTLTEKQLDKLNEAGIYTVGQFEAVRGGKDNRYPGGIIDLPGIGVTTLSKWEDQMIEWLIEQRSEKSEEDTGGDSV
jgi:hypothetical protein